MVFGRPAVTEVSSEVRRAFFVWLIRNTARGKRHPRTSIATVDMIRNQCFDVGAKTMRNQRTESPSNTHKLLSINIL